MSKELYLHTLQQIRDGCLAENMDTEAEALEAAIQALSCDGDAVSRQAVFGCFYGVVKKDDCLEYIKNVITKIRDLPSAQPEPQWIQGKPKKDGEYLVSGTGHFVPDHVDEPDTVNGVVGIALYSAKWGWLDHKIDPIEAYMPRPEPWRGEGHE